MKRNWKKLAILMLVCALVIALPVGLRAAAAPKTANLTVRYDDAKYLTDVQKADDVEPDLPADRLAVDLYLVAAGEVGEDEVALTPEAAFSGLRLSSDYSFDEGSADWLKMETLAQDAAEIALGGATRLTPNVSDQKLNTKIRDLEPGMYLVVVRDVEADNAAYVNIPNQTGTAKSEILVSRVQTEYYNYYFRPILVTVPGHVLDTDGNPVPGQWNYDGFIETKDFQELRTGTLRIVKTLTEEIENGKVDSFTFRFDVYWPDDDTLYTSDVRRIVLPGDNWVDIPGLPAGAKVVVTEVNSGVSHEYVSDSMDPADGIIQADEFLTATFLNRPTEGDGGSIDNKFVWTQFEDGTWGWDVVKIPDTQ